MYHVWLDTMSHLYVSINREDVLVRDLPGYAMEFDTNLGSERSYESGRSRGGGGSVGGAGMGVMKGGISFGGGGRDKLGGKDGVVRKSSVSGRSKDGVCVLDLVWVWVWAYV